MNSSPEEGLFQLALAKPAEKRAAFLDVMCEGDPALRQRLEALLAAHEQPETMLETRRDELRGSPTPRQGAAKVQGFAKDQGLVELGPPGDAPDEAVGQTLGRYKLLERVGVVNVVEQTELVWPTNSRRVNRYPAVESERKKGNHRWTQMNTDSAKQA